MTSGRLGTGVSTTATLEKSQGLVDERSHCGICACEAHGSLGTASAAAWAHLPGAGAWRFAKAPGAETVLAALWLDWLKGPGEDFLAVYPELALDSVAEHTIHDLVIRAPVGLQHGGVRHTGSPSPVRVAYVLYRGDKYCLGLDGVWQDVALVAVCRAGLQLDHHVGVLALARRQVEDDAGTRLSLCNSEEATGPILLAEREAVGLDGSEGAARLWAGRGGPRSRRGWRVRWWWRHARW